MKVVAIAHNGYKEKFGVPRQAGCADSVLTQIVFESEFRNPDYIRGIEQFSYLWLIWGFSANDDNYSPTVRPPRLGGNKRVGVFASRSPFRPNGLGLSSVKLIEVKNTNKGNILIVSGADLMDGTPIYDIKPYIPYADIHNDANGGFTQTQEWKQLQVEFNQELISKLSPQIITELQQILSQDPRPAYHNDERLYGLKYADYDVKFQVVDNILKVVAID